MSHRSAETVESDQPAAEGSESQYARVCYEAALSPGEALRRLGDDSFRVMARHGGTVWGAWTALFGMVSVDRA